MKTGPYPCRHFPGAAECLFAGWCTTMSAHIISFLNVLWVMCDMIVTGLTGAIISPYLFFWQTSAEVEAGEPAADGNRTVKRYRFLLMRKDILSGAFFAVLIMYFIILTTGTVLHENGIRNINSVKDAAMALRPLAGNLSYLLFSIGAIGTGFLIIPVLSATISYIIMEAFNFKAGLNKKPGEARLFYIVIGISMCIGSWHALASCQFC